jgi:DNA-binding CsgD family transcriptional regulator
MSLTISRTAPVPNAIFESPRRRVITRHADRLIEIRLREALAREQALVRQKNEVIRELFAWAKTAATNIARLSPRERQIMELVLAGHPSKNIAANLGISQRTVENHRASIMKKTGSKSLPALARLALVAVWSRADEPGAALQPAPDRLANSDLKHRKIGPGCH